MNNAEAPQPRGLQGTCNVSLASTSVVKAE